VDVIERRNDRGALVDREGCPAGARQDSVANAGARLAPGKLPILNGLWADSQRGGCARLNPRRADGDPAFIIDDNKMVQVQDYYELLPLQNLGSGRYRTGTELDNQTIRVIDPKNITIETGNTGSYVWCSPATEWEPWQG
jgi:hypothetical protein